MAEAVKTSSAAEATNGSEVLAPGAEDHASAAAVESKPEDSGDAGTATKEADEVKVEPSKAADEATANTADDATADTTVEEGTSDNKVEHGEEGTAATNEVATNGTPASKKAAANGRRKSGAGIAEHKKKTPSKKKAAPEIRLNVQPGDMFFVAMRGYQPWPVIVTDEAMLPEILLQKRPVSAMRLDGTYREDFRDDGKNVKDRRYPVMFLGTNEFSWELNTALQTLDLDAVKKEVEAGNNTKKSKALWAAYEIAAEGHDLDYFKNMLKDHEEAMQVDQEEQDVAVAKKKEKGKRKSTALEDAEDAEMGGDGEVKKPKSSKKRKKEAESEGEPEKTPKHQKLKLNNKAPKDASATKAKKETKPKKVKGKADNANTETKPEEKPMTDAERREKQEKSVLYLRHRLQKGFLARDQAPKEEEMANMNQYLTELENVQNLEAEIIKKTKVHKVLKAIMKLESIPKEEEYDFKKRSIALLNSWNNALASDDPAADAPAATTNGVNHDGKKAESAEPADTATKVEATSTVADADGDTTMADANDKPSDTKVDVLAADESGDKAVADPAKPVEVTETSAE